MFYNLGNALYMTGSVEDAIFNYKKALDLNPRKVECVYNLGNAFCNTGKHQEAIQYYLKTISLDPQHDPAFYNLGYAYHMIKQYD